MGNHETGTSLAFDEITLNFGGMKLLVRTLLVLAALAYVAMPFTGVAAATPGDAAAIAAGTLAEPDATGHAPHDHAMHAEAKTAAQADADCPHPGKTDRTPHCAACITLPADFQITAFGKQPRAAEAPAVVVVFSSWPAAPLDPPPRV